MIRAVCPLCERTVNAHGLDGRLVYVAHRVSRRGRGNGPRCEASGWLVEDDELAPMSAAGRASHDLAVARRMIPPPAPSPVPQESER